jgi:predicted ABC-class ATPase
MQAFTEVDWTLCAKSILKSKMKRRGFTYIDLAERLTSLGGKKETDANLRNKVSRGTFTAAFFLQCLVAMNVRTLLIDEDMEVERD